MPKIKIPIFVIIILLVAVISSVIVYKKLIPQEKIHYHAGFVVFENNIKIDFSSTKFMYTKPCLADGKEDSKNEDVQLEKAHLHDNIGDLVHVEENNAKWRDLFTNIKYPIDYTSVRGYINNQIVPDFQNFPIHPYDSLVIFIGENDSKFLKEAVTKEYIETQSKKSKSCSD